MQYFWYPSSDSAPDGEKCLGICQEDVDLREQQQNCFASNMFEDSDNGKP